jgi:serine/threonine protein kinase
LPTHRSDGLVDLTGILRDATSDTPMDTSLDTWGPLAKEVIGAVMRHHRDPSEPLVTFGRFEAIGTCGAGGHGYVFRARDPALDRPVALKLCRLRRPEAAEALVREAKTLAKLSHPNIVRVYELGHHGDDVFLVMELVEGGSTLEDLIARRPPWEVCIDVFREAGQGLAAAHGEEIVHGDFKPANVLLDADQHPLIADFGLARVVHEHEPEAGREALRRRTGTLLYMAPEVLRGHAADRLADQWSFAVSLWQALDHGQVPFPGVTTEQVLAAIENGPREVNPNVPAAVRAVVRRGLSIDPSERYADMDEFVRALDRLRTPSSVPRTAGWIAFGVALGGALASGLAVLVLGPASHAAALVDVPTQIELPEPIELPYPHNLTSLCAMGDEEMSIDDEKLLKTCKQIRHGQLDSAQTVWQNAYNERLSGDRLKLTEATLIVARTFVDHAKRTKHSGPEDAVNAAWHGLGWARIAADLISPHEGMGDPRVDEIMKASNAIVGR